MTAAAAVNPNGIQTSLVNSLNTFPFKCSSVFSNGPESLALRILLIILFYATELFIILY